jgi:hypothetical protein
MSKTEKAPDGRKTTNNNYGICKGSKVILTNF